MWKRKKSDQVEATEVESPDEAAVDDEAWSEKGGKACADQDLDTAAVVLAATTVVNM